MNTLKTLNTLAVLLVALAAIPAAQADSQPKVKSLIDFRQRTVERDGASMREVNKYGYAYGDWDKKIIFLEGRGLLVQAPGGQGGFGGDKSIKIKPGQVLALEVVIGNQNKAAGFGVNLTDADGTEQSWNLPLAGNQSGVGLVYQINLGKCDRESKPGSKPGLDTTRIKKWQIQGNWQKDFSELLVVQWLVVDPPTK